METPLSSEALRALSALHRRRLREIWRSAGWPCQDLIEVELLAAGLLQRQRDGDGRESLRVTDAGIGVLAATLKRNRAARDAHEALVARVAREMQRAGRLVWRGLSLRAKVGEGDDAAWAMAMPDVYSIRHTTVEDYVEPVAHEIKVHRADLLSDLRRPHKGEAYLQTSSQWWYVLREGIGEADEIPAAFGVMLARESALRCSGRRRKGAQLPFAVWMVLARAAPEPLDDGAQNWLGAPPDARGLNAAVALRQGERTQPLQGRCGRVPGTHCVSCVAEAQWRPAQPARIPMPARFTAIALRTFLLTCCFAVLGVARAGDDGVAWQPAANNADIDRAFSQARSESKPVLLYWGAKWCPPCNQLKATLFNRHDFIERSKSLVAVEIDGDLPGAQKLGARFKVSGYPTMVLFTPDGAS